jgi:AcrR family transcriptional regulator
MYQYFPHKEALLYAVLEDYLEDVILAMEDAARRYDGASLVELSDALSRAYLDAKMRRMPGSRALYIVADMLETASLVDDIVRRADDIIRRMLASASDARFDDVDRVTYAMRTMLVGTVRAVLESDGSAEAVAMLRAELPVMCRSYLLASASRRNVHPVY